MGRSLRTHRYRYTEWAETGQPPVGVELYDYEKDPGETANLVDHSANMELVQSLRTQLYAGWQSALPARQTKLR